MPLTKAGSKTLRNMKGEYGSKKGESVFYALMNKKTPSQQRKYHAVPKKGK